MDINFRLIIVIIIGIIAIMIIVIRPSHYLNYDRDNLVTGGHSPFLIPDLVFF